MSLENSSTRVTISFLEGILIIIGIIAVFIPLIFVTYQEPATKKIETSQQLEKKLPVPSYQEPRKIEETEVKIEPEGAITEGDIKEFHFSEVISNNLPRSAEGYACASCSGTYNYECPMGHYRTECEHMEIGSHGCCSTCLVVRVRCVK